MADPKQSDDSKESASDDESDVYVPPPKSPAPLARKRRKSLPSVESSLDAFIERANEKLLDVSSFTPETREEQLRREVETLQRKLESVERNLAAAEERAAIASERPSRSWGGILAAFVVGAASMFAVSFLLPKNAEEPKPVVSAPAPQPTEHATTPERAPIDQPPAEHAPAEMPPVAQPPAEDAAADKVAADKAAADKAAADKVAADKVGATDATKTRHANVAKKKRPTTPADATPTTKPSTPEKASGSDGDLYNPF